MSGVDLEALGAFGASLECAVDHDATGEACPKRLVFAAVLELRRLRAVEAAAKAWLERADAFVAADADDQLEAAGNLGHAEAFLRAALDAKVQP